MNIQETSLPGVGVRHDFVSREGQRIGVISHRGGRRDLLVYRRNDPDACAQTVRLEPEETQALSEMLGGGDVSHTLAASQQSVGGLTIDWLPVNANWGCTGHPLSDAEPYLKDQTGVALVAVVRDSRTYASPPPDFELMAGDQVVVVGTPDAIARTAELLRVL